MCNCFCKRNYCTQGRNKCKKWLEYKAPAKWLFVVNRARGRCYYCSERERCKAAIHQVDDDIKFIGNHTCGDPDPALIEVYYFKDYIRSHASRRISTQNLYDDAEKAYIFPIAWVFMKKRTENDYREVFKKIFVNFEAFDGIVMTDFEIGLRNALEKILPKAQLKECFFHHTQILLNLWIENAYEQFIESLPEEYDVIFDPVLTYYEDYWLKQRTPKDYSVYDVIHKTNHFAESYHAKLKEIMGFLEKAERNYSLVSKGVSVSTTSKTLVHSSQIKEAWTKVDQGRITYLNFLRQMSLLIKASSPNYEVPSNDEDSSDSDD
ncbi:hypothetical protein KQX54_018301 [Cotesia glomerata]|uniref:MULE transposase domain-containing protein n=1 Tax=Cotesia glomerata TaxID=32391 RepID=A0AAV7IRY3_COTGL|nr:hypothetical protein KQX54_018301 [Cotesia glomerata]